MYRFKQILTTCKFDGTDETAIQYSGLISEQAETDKAVFWHKATHVEISDEIKEKYPELIEPVEEYATNKMEELVAEHFKGNKSTAVEYKVTEGDLDDLLKFIADNSIDLVIVGKDNDDDTTKRFAEKVARKAPCSVLIVPKGAKPEFKNIVMPIDFSEHSDLAFDETMAIATASKLKEITTLNVYEVHPGYHKTGKSFEEFAEIMKENAKKEYTSFIKNHEDLKGLTINANYILDDDTADGILKYLKKEQKDLIVIGSRGRSTGAAILLGSVTEKLIHNAEISVLSVKQKGAGMSFLKALLNI